MGTHPIFESDFDCLTVLDCLRNGSSFFAGLEEKDWI